ncbi:GTP cyclohydrolase 1 type 2 [Patiriisocius marinus]|uniref:GTP cyclohydrolase 1 type 2 homolog n=1 Tax=Patiriisocius marinus TaxID=1397112 RepID=A0A5J4IXV1_9FLAO|nr:Nif3-like dinuclear metal center hexameric protein [Patiriisocius marinus]GER59794.1 GTP cyclohydrolase 1 type 2 [Patiriisocius marinus]
MNVKDILSLLNDFAPLHYTEGFDNTGLLVGNPNALTTGVLVTLDTLENIVDEAIQRKCNVIVSFHPIIFSGLKKITGKSYVERVVLKAIKNDINIIAIHTALDNSFQGVNAKICDVLGLENREVLIPKEGTIKKLTTYVPVKDAQKLKNALFSVGAGSIGNYDNCSFSTDGIGTYKGNENSNPVIGERGVVQEETETQLNITFHPHLEAEILKTLHTAHPYEEVAYELTTLNNMNQHIGMGMIGTLSESMNELEFLKFLKKKMKTDCVRHSNLQSKTIKKVAVLGGSGSFAIKNAINKEADAYVTADCKYHDFFSAENNILLADIGHYESEQYTKELLHAYLTKKMPNFAVVLSQINTNPISYF